MSRVLVTGAAGFIGRHLVQRLVATGTEVIGLDRVCPPDTPVPWICADVGSHSVRELRIPMVSCIIHAAAITGVTAASRNPSETLRVNAGGTIRTLEMAHRASIDHFCLLSSSEVYGEAGINPISEDAPLEPRSIYGRAKVAAEHAVIASVGDFRRTIIRPFNVYGPGQRDDFVIPRFVKNGLQGRPQPLAGDGSQVRTFTYIDDLVTGVLLAIKRSDPTPGVYNIGGLDRLTIAALAAKIDALTANARRPVRMTLDELERPRGAEIHARYPNVERATRELGFRPVVTLDAGLTAVIASMRDALAA